jgi:hypothetical protein
VNPSSLVHPDLVEHLVQKLRHRVQRRRIPRPDRCRGESVKTPDNPPKDSRLPCAVSPLITTTGVWTHSPTLGTRGTATVSRKPETGPLRLPVPNTCPSLGPPRPTPAAVFHASVLDVVDALLQRRMHICRGVVRGPWRALPFDRSYQGDGAVFDDYM